MSAWEAKLSLAGQRAVAGLRRDAEHWRTRAEKAEAHVSASWLTVREANRIVERQNRCIGKIAQAIVSFGKRSVRVKAS